MQPRKVEAGNGWLWLKQSFELFQKTPGTWLLMTAGFFLLTMLAGKIPVLGLVSGALMSTLLLAGFVLAARDLHQGRPLDPAPIIAALQQHAGQLLIVGAVTAFATLFATAMAVATLLFTGLGPLLGITLPFELPLPLLLLLDVMAVAALAVTGMAAWFAPQLVVLRGLPASRALLVSFEACQRNMGALTVFGLCAGGLALGSIFTLFLGLLVLVPVLLIASYTEFQDLFGE